ncbi:MAG: NTP transferase domain-containing protein [Candidatus Doudnabacteria bacterium]
MSQQVVILAAGKGTRMGSDIPKVLLPLHGQPVIKHVLNEVSNLILETSPVLVVGYKEELVKQELGDEYIYVTQFDQKGTAHAVMSAQPKISAQNFIVLYGDMPFTSLRSLQKLSDLHQSNDAKISMFTAILPDFQEEHEHFLGFGRIIRDKQGNICKIVEYKDASPEEQEITEVNPGIYMFNSKWVWEQLKKIGSQNSQQEFYLTDVIELAIKDGQKIFSLPIAAEEVYGINTPEHLEFARKLTD